jgi:uncharacterized membrane protein YdjX (TVP38/TMEM64 family)
MRARPDYDGPVPNRPVWKTETMALPDAANENRSRRRAMTRFAPLVVLVLGLIAFFALDLERYVRFSMLCEHRDALVGWTADEPLLAPIVFILGYAAMVAFSLPGGILATVLGGFLFGTAAGAAYVVVGATAGATILFLAARSALGDILRARAGPALKRMEAGFQEGALSYLLVLRLVPIFPFWLVNLVPAFLDVKLRVYVVATFLGIIPGTVVFAGIGSGLGALLAECHMPDFGVVFRPEILLPLLGLAVLALIPVLYRRWQARRGRQ